MISLVVGVFLWPICLLADTSASLSTSNDTITNVQMLMHTYKKAEKAHIQLDKRLVLCEAAAKKNQLTKKRLDRFSLTASQWRLALLHLNMKAQHRCMGSMYEETALALEKYFYLEKELTGSNTQPVIIPATNDQQLPASVTPAYVREIFYGNAKNVADIELRYLSLPADVRHILENAPEFSKPFDFQAIFDALIPKSESK